MARLRNKTRWWWPVRSQVCAATFGTVAAQIICVVVEGPRGIQSTYYCYIGDAFVGEESNLKLAQERLVLLCSGSGMMAKYYDKSKKPLATWVSEKEYELFCAVARANNVKPAAYLRAVICDVLAEEEGKLPSGALGPRPVADLFKAEVA